MKKFIIHLVICIVKEYIAEEFENYLKELLSNIFVNFELQNI